MSTATKRSLETKTDQAVFNEPYYVLVTGSRTWSDVETIRKTMTLYTPSHKCVKLIHGVCGGVDHMAEKISRELKWDPSIIYTITQFDWNKYGKAAGPNQNRRMITNHGAQVDLFLVFSHGESSGTEGTLQLIKEVSKKRGALVSIHRS
jgi:hypothetical protein